MIRLEDFRVPEAPPTCFYVPNFISEDEELYLIERILSAPKPKWQQLSNRRLQNWGGIIGKKGSLIRDDVIPDWLQRFMDRVSGVEGIFAAGEGPNHVLVNEYEPGQGIMVRVGAAACIGECLQAHEDGPAFAPTITTISLGSHTLLQLSARRHADDAAAAAAAAGALLLERRSLLVLRDRLYDSHLHAIAERHVDSSAAVRAALNAGRLGDADLLRAAELPRATRHSLTIRRVPRVAPLSLSALLSPAT